MKLNFWLLINVKGFFKVMLSFYICVASNVEITQNKKFVISLQYLKKEVRNKVDFLHEDIHESLLQVDTMILMGMVKHSKVPKMASLQWVYNISKKNLKRKLIFCMEINIKVTYKLISTLWSSKFTIRRYYLYWRAWSSFLKILKILIL